MENLLLKIEPSEITSFVYNNFFRLGYEPPNPSCVRHWFYWCFSSKLFLVHFVFLSYLIHEQTIFPHVLMEFFQLFFWFKCRWPYSIDFRMYVELVSSCMTIIVTSTSLEFSNRNANDVCQQRGILQVCKFLIKISYLTEI